MKKKNTKRDFGKFAGKSSDKRRSADLARRELERMIRETNIKADGVRFKSVTDRGRGGRGESFAEERAVGVFSASKSDYGFVRAEGKSDIFIPAGYSLNALDGDTVEVEYRIYKNRFGEEKTEGRVKKITEYGRKTIIGTLTEELVLFGRRRRGYVTLIVPDDMKVTPRIRIGSMAGARIGDKVEAKLIRGRELFADVVRIFGNAYSFGANYEAHLAECGIEQEFSEAALLEAGRVSRELVVPDGRVDRREEIIFTIDGAGAKDLDDAVSLRKLRGGSWQLGVHIADVSHYVRERTALDRAAMSRGTSVYFTDKVVPMLPEALSNGSCSLNAGEDKYALSAIINISAEGEILDVKIEPSVINSRVRGVYSEVNQIFEGTASPEILKKYKSVLPTLRKMHELYFVLKEKSRARGALELDFPEAELILSSDGTPCEILKRERGDAELLIEQFMLAANESVARLLTEQGIPCVYRIHEPPPEDKLREFVTFAHNLGFDTSYISLSKASPCDFSRLLSEAEKRELLTSVSYTMLRSMSKARYSDVRVAHFGLGISHYCHFTSPIRRLSDLATHRIIHKVLIEGKASAQYSAYARRAAKAASDAELRAVSAERRIENMYKALYMSERIGEIFDARISSVTSFGFFAELENTCEGLVPISELEGVFSFDEKTLTLRSRNVTYKLADFVRVRLEEVDVMRGKLSFSVAK